MGEFTGLGARFLHPETSSAHMQTTSVDIGSADPGRNGLIAGAAMVGAIGA